MIYIFGPVDARSDMFNNSSATKFIIANLGQIYLLLVAILHKSFFLILGSKLANGYVPFLRKMIFFLHVLSSSSSGKSLIYTL